MIILLDAFLHAGLGGFMVKVLLMGLVLMGGSQLLEGVVVKDFSRAVIAAVLLAILNATLGDFLHKITTPLRWITLGFFGLVVNAVVLMVAAHFMKGFSIKNFTWALLLAAIVTIANTILHI